MWEWLPNQSVGNIYLGETLSSVKTKYTLLKTDMNALTGWSTYYISEDDIYLDFEEEQLISITSYKAISYKGINCIGLSIIELDELLETKPDEIGESVEYDDNQIKTPREYTDLGLQIWTSNDFVCSITCLTYDDE